MTESQELVLIKLLLDYKANQVPEIAIINFVKLVVERKDAKRVANDCCDGDR
jgi:Skp family chaperone for outer membrane proteins